MKKLKFTFVTIFIVVLFALAACNNNASGNDINNNNNTNKTNSSDKNAVNIGVTHSPSNINPLQPEGLVSTYVANLLFLPLMNLDSDLEFQPMLAESITTEDDTTFLINIEENATWTDGSDITADDLIFTLELMTNPETASNLAYLFAIIEGIDQDGYMENGESSIQGVEKIDKKTVEMTTKSPTTLQIFKDTVGRNLLTLPKAELEDIDPSDINKSDFMLHPTVTSGPFKLDEIDRNHYVEMVPNEDYFRGASELDQLNFKVIEGNQIAGQLKNGEIDMNIPSAGVIPVSDYDVIKSLDNVGTEYGEPLATQYMYINEEVIPEIEQRQAISYAINRQLIVDNLLKGAGEVTDGFFQSISPYLHEDITPVSYDPEKAKQLLNKSNWDSNKQLTMAVLSGDETLKQAANIIAENLNEVGFNIDIRMMDLGTLFEEIESMDYDIAILSVSMTPINPLPDIKYFISGENPNAYSNDQVNEIIQALSEEADEEKVKELYKELQEITSDEVPMPSVYSTTALGAVNKRVNGATPSDFGMFINVHEWTID